MYDRAAAAKEATGLHQASAKVEERLGRHRSDLSAARGKGTPEQIALLEDVVALEQSRMLALHQLALGYEAVAAGRRAFGPIAPSGGE